MLDRRRFLAVSATACVAGCARSGTSTADTTTGRTTTGATATEPTAGDVTTGTTTGAGLAVSTDAFADGESIPAKYTADGEDVSPPFTLDGMPDGAEALAVVVDDPDAGDFVHWLLWNVPADTTSLPEGIPRNETVETLDGARQGTNGFGEIGYRGPSPPSGDGPHIYEFTFHALESTLDVQAGAERSELSEPLSSSTVETVTYTGTYDR